MRRPSDGMELEELREEFDWISEFQSRMAERIRGDADVHNLVDYVNKLESENAKLRDELDFCLRHVPNCDECEAMLDCHECLRADHSQKERKRLDYENEKLRELVRRMAKALGVGSGWCLADCGAEFGCDYTLDGCPLAESMRELGVEVGA